MQGVVDLSRVYNIVQLGDLFDSISSNAVGSSIVLILDRLASLLNVQRVVCVFLGSYRIERVNRIARVA